MFNYPDKTVTVEVTPTSTEYNVYSTRVVTVLFVSTDSSTTITATVTPTQSAKRQTDEGFDFWEKLKIQAANAGLPAPDDSLVKTAFENACQCQSFAGNTVTSTFTDDSTVATLDEFDVTTTTYVATSTALSGVAEVTATVDASASADPETAVSQGTATTTSAPDAATPVAPALACPADNNTIVSQLVGNQRYGYLILCDSELTSPVCRGVLYNAGEQSNNCILNDEADATEAAGSNVALLQRIAVGINGNTPTTITPAIGTPTSDAAQVSSSLDSILISKSETIPMTTLVPVTVTQSGMIHSTYVSEGTTYFVGTCFTSATPFADGP
ncbi:hypothetical protein K470DRAFT_69125 [Piedraia hortae CBS 480.64]|uniref:Uncharacterized protein n=1 Tax=Piedraia hortae CBS 480.64 TaxID=1314780 RepID=A0A6A7BZY4_9PEZI|nr:hypothetical protein K470DRAFT_69125 [Piedraia hortae CBS 480.64]